MMEPKVEGPHNRREILCRGGGSMGAAGVFAHVNFQQRVHCTRPDEELNININDPFSVRK